MAEEQVGMNIKRERLLCFRDAKRLSFPNRRTDGWNGEEAEVVKVRISYTSLIQGTLDKSKNAQGNTCLAQSPFTTTA